MLLTNCYDVNARRLKLGTLTQAVEHVNTGHFKLIIWTPSMFYHNLHKQSFYVCHVPPEMLHLKLLLMLNERLSEVCAEIFGILVFTPFGSVNKLIIAKIKFTLVL